MLKKDIKLGDMLKWENSRKPVEVIDTSANGKVGILLHDKSTFTINASQLSPIIDEATPKVVESDEVAPVPVPKVVIEKFYDENKECGFVVIDKKVTICIPDTEIEDIGVTVKSDKDTYDKEIGFGVSLLRSRSSY